MRLDAEKLSALGNEIGSIRRRKFAFSEGGTMPGINSVAAPVWHDSPEPFGSVVLTSDDTNMPSEKFDAFGATVVSMAEEATRALGGDQYARGAAADLVNRT